MSRYERMGAMFMETVLPDRMPDVKLSNQLKADILKEIVLLESLPISKESIEERAKILQAVETEKRIKQGTDPRGPCLLGKTWLAKQKQHFQLRPSSRFTGGSLVRHCQTKKVVERISSSQIVILPVR